MLNRRSKSKPLINLRAMVHNSRSQSKAVDESQNWNKMITGENHVQNGYIRVHWFQGKMRVKINS